jgi:hypothetical protein
MFIWSRLGCSHTIRLYIKADMWTTLFGMWREVKVKVTVEQATKVHRGSRGAALLFFNLGARWGEWSMPRPGRFTPRETLYTLHRKLGGP